MENTASIKKNFILNALLTAASVVFPLITFPYVSRVLLAEGTGKVSFSTSLISYFLLLSQLGIPTYGIRVCAALRNDRKELSKCVKELLLINIIMSCLAYFFLFVCILLIPRFAQEKEIIIISGLAIVLNAVGMEWLYKGLEKYQYITIRSLVFKIISILLMFLFVKDADDTLAYAGILVFATYGSYIFNLIRSGKYVDLISNGHKEKLEIKKHFKPVCIFFAMSCATTIYTNLDTVMLGLMTSNEEVGYYHVATRIKTILVSLITSLGAVLLPRMSYYAHEKRMDDFMKINAKAMHFVILAATPLSVYFVMFSREIIFFLAGDGYEQSIYPMQIIIPTLLLIGITNVLGIQILVPLGFENKVLISVVLGAVVDLIVNLLLIPRFASSGAALGTLVAEMVVLAVQLYFLKAYVRRIFYNRDIWKIIFITLLLIIVSLLVKGIECQSLVKIAISLFVFWGLYGVGLIVLKESLVLEFIKKIIKR